MATFPRLAASAVSLLLVVPAAAAEDAALGSVRLRGGFDANPQLLPGGRGSAFAGIDGGFAIGREWDGLKAGLLGEIGRTEYAARGTAPSEQYRLSLEAERTQIPDWTLRSTSTMQNNASATLRSFEAFERVRAQWTGGAVRPFLSAEVRYASLNETNAVLTQFLPEPQRYGRATLVPGATMKAGDAEFGASLNMSATRYVEPFDIFGFRRDNERVEPFVFYRYEGKGVSVNASLSQLYGTWQDPDFSRVREILYDVSLTRTAGPWSLELGAKRYAAETTFPISPITINSNEYAQLTFSAEETWTVAVLARALRTAYPDSPFASRTFAYGASLSYAISKNLTLGAEVLRINGRALNGDPVDGGVATISLNRKFSAGDSNKPSDSEKQWAAKPPPIAQPSPPRGPLLRGPLPGTPYQP